MENPNNNNQEDEGESNTNNTSKNILSKELISKFHHDGFLLLPNQVIPDKIIDQLHEQYIDLFNGKFETGIYPDEWHWRSGISLPLATKEICNGWKSNKLIASIVLSKYFGKLACEVMSDWTGTRIGQDDIIWKPAQGGSEINFHQDSAYISKNFIPVKNNSITIWCALDDANEETGCLEYVRGSHKWNTTTNNKNDNNMDFHCCDGTINSYQEPVYKAAAASNTSNNVSVPPLDIVKVKVPKGGCIIHHQDIWHGSGKNNHPSQPRRAIVAHLLRHDVLFQEDDSYCSSSGSAAPMYIYGRYKRIDNVDVDESFFPITYCSKNGYRTKFLKDYCTTNVLDYLI